jgi:hypothetical protein
MRVSHVVLPFSWDRCSMIEPAIRLNSFSGSEARRLEAVMPATRAARSTAT